VHDGEVVVMTKEELDEAERAFDALIDRHLEGRRAQAAEGRETAQPRPIA
jgi:hypothetical protein